MKHTIFFLLALALFWGCITDREPDARSKVTVELTVRPDPMTATTRATDEAAIRDLNFYLIDRKGAVVVYRYLTATTLRFECLPGDYLVRIAANVGRSLGETADLSQYKVTYQEHYDMLPMFCEQKTTISLSADGVVQLPPITVERVVSKISYNLTAKPADMELKSVQLISIPRTVVLFAPDGTASENPDDYTDSPETTLTGQQAAGSYYMLPNRQGVNTSITDQKQKNADNAPACASWLLIRATRGSKVLAYSVFLGENNTSDFNVRANCLYTLNISILNDNTVDTRIAAYTANVYDDYENSSYGGYCFYTPDNCLYIEMINDNYNLSINGRLEITQGDSKYFTFNRRNGSNSWNFEIGNPYGFNDYYLDYCPSVYTRENSTLSYRVTLTDEYGFAQNYDFTHKLANVVTVYANTADRITADKYLHSETQNWKKGKLTRILCYDDDLKLIATATDNTVFDGWYQDAAYTTKLSSAATYTLKPSSPFHSIYARFRAVGTPLDSQGTANCYIAPKLNTAYSFNATVQGNGVTTLNVTPKRLYGTTAKVIWETGSVRNAVIASALYNNGRIYFQTGTVQGNAVIGLFDDTGNCVWSWHIWAVNYNPASYQQTYSTGAVFMDRNLGAESTSPTDVKTKGLYYQWGRKDPFIYPATNKKTDNNTPATVTCLDGYKFEAYGQQAGQTYPVNCHTIAWATAHPTTLLAMAPEPAGSDKVYSSAWYTPLNPNLWGNGTNGTTVSNVNTKTIYDPCPPGWRVPHPEAWDTNYFKKSSVKTDCGWDMYYASSSSTTYYPYTGFLDGVNNGLQYYWPAYQVRIWTNTPVRTTSKDCAHYLYILDSGIVAITNSGNQHYGHTVRCIRE